jgi:ubiquitin C-terminal hydrolase
MSLSKFDYDKMLKTCGLINTGALCYLNSLIQSLMSCTSLTDFFLKKEETFIKEENKVALEYIKILKKLKNIESYNDTINIVGLSHEIIKFSNKRKDNIQMGYGQEDSGEGLTLFLEAINNEELYQFFMYKYIVSIWCTNCIKLISEKTDESCILEVPLHFSGLIFDDKEKTNIDPLNAHIYQYLNILEDYTCHICKLNKCYRIYQLVSAPEIITIMFNKYFKKPNIDFKNTLTFPSHNDINIEYKIVAQIEHKGNMNGGHYWSHCFRIGEPDKNSNEPIKKMYKLNDIVVEHGTDKPSKDSYFVFYHLI